MDNEWEATTSTLVPVPPPAVWLRLPTYRSRFTPVLLGLIVLVWLAGIVYALQRSGVRDPASAVDLITHFVVGSNDPRVDQTLLDFGAKVNYLIAHGEYWRLLTATFLHASLPHLLLNGWALYLFGPLIERLYGGWRYLVIYLIAGLGGSIASFAFGAEVSVGASGAIFGLIGAMAVYYWLHRRLTGAQGRVQLTNALFMVVLNLGFGISQAQIIDNWGHIGGLVFGSVAGLVLVPRYRPGAWLSPRERALEDRLPPWGAALASAGLLVGTVVSFLVALAFYRG